MAQATFAMSPGTCGTTAAHPERDGNGTGIQLQQSDGSVTNSVIFCTKLGIHLNGGNVILENLHVYPLRSKRYVMYTTKFCSVFHCVWNI